MWYWYLAVFVAGAITGMFFMAILGSGKIYDLEIELAGKGELIKKLSTVSDNKNGSFFKLDTEETKSDWLKEKINKGEV